MADCEVLEAKLKALEKHVHFKFEANEKALGIQAKEYERRLEALNGEAERLRKMQATYLPREVFDKIHDSIVADIEDLKRARDEGVGRQYVISAIVSAAIAIGITLAVAILVG